MQSGAVLGLDFIQALQSGFIQSLKRVHIILSLFYFSHLIKKNQLFLKKIV